MDKNIKDYREKELKYYVIGNAFIILLLTRSLNGITANLPDESCLAVPEIVKMLISAGIFASILYVYVYIFDAIIPGDWKFRICNLGCPLPGETIFEDILNEKIKDKRFTKKSVVEKYKDIYEELEKLPVKQQKEVSNELWNKLYRICEFEPRILVSHRDYLLCRDICVATVWIGIIYIALVILSVVHFAYQVLIFLIVELLLTNFATRKKQWMFARNVIATDVHSPK